MLPETAPSPFDSEKHLFEIKWDGIRAILFLTRDKLRIQSRSLQEVTHRYPELLSLKNYFKKEAVIDGEIVILSEGKPSFDKIQEREHQDREDRIEIYAKIMPVTFVAFDLLYFEDEKLLNKPLRLRKELLRENFSENPRFILSRSVKKEGRKFYEKALKLGFEGVIAKEIESPYLPGKRSSYWLKVKKTKTLDLVICGFTTGGGERNKLFGSLVLGAFDRRGNLKHVAQVGTGFSQRDLKFLLSALEPLKQSESPFGEEVKARGKIKWVKPKLVCEVKFTEFTPSGSLRSPVFIRLRPDRLPEECLIEEGRE